MKVLCAFQVDPYLGISEDLQVYVRPQIDAREYGSVMDNQLASMSLDRLRKKVNESEKIILDILVRNLCSITEVCISFLVILIVGKPLLSLTFIHFL